MKALVVYYSGTGHTRTVADEIAAAVNGDIGLIVEVGEKREGVMGKIHSGVESLLKEKSKIEKPKYDPADYDLVFVGTPTWGGGRESCAAWRQLPLSNHADITCARLLLHRTRGRQRAVFKTMRELTPGCNVAGDLVVKSGELEDMDKVKAKISDWIATLKTE